MKTKTKIFLLHKQYKYKQPWKLKGKTTLNKSCINYSLKTLRISCFKTAMSKSAFAMRW